MIVINCNRVIFYRMLIFPFCNKGKKKDSLWKPHVRCCVLIIIFPLCRAVDCDGHDTQLWPDELKRPLCRK